jgi:hypothetical protein
MSNYAFGIVPIPDVENGHTFTGDNFLQINAHTKILEGKSGLTFINCNLTNCDPPADSVYIGCAPRHCSFCSHEHPKFTKYGLAECAVDCAHVISTDSVVIDGVVVDTHYYYNDTGVD